MTATQMNMMQRGAEEANNESHQYAQAKAMGEAIGGLTALVAAINRLEQRVASLESEVFHLRHVVNGTQS